MDATPQIEAGIPMPSRNWQAATRKTVLDGMASGDSFAIEPSARTQWLAAGQRLEGKTFRTRTLPNGEMRIWRTA